MTNETYETHESHETTETHTTGAGDRTLETIATEIKAIQRQNKKIMLAAAVEIGRCLMEAKSLIPYGEFNTWLTKALNYSKGTAYLLMRICEEYGPALAAAEESTGTGNNTSLNAKSSTSLGGSAEASPFAGLNYSQAIALLAIPAEERAEFISALDLDNLSIRELKQAIAARNQARAEKEALNIKLNYFQRTVEFLREKLQKTNAELEKRTKKSWREQSDINKLKHDLNALKDETKFGQRMAELEQQRNEAVIRMNSAKADAHFELIVKEFNNLYGILHDMFPTDPEAFATYVLRIDRFLWKMSQGLKRLESEAAFHSLKLAKQAAAEKAAEILAAEEEAETEMQMADKAGEMQAAAREAAESPAVGESRTAGECGSAGEAEATGANETAGATESSGTAGSTGATKAAEAAGMASNSPTGAQDT